MDNELLLAGLNECRDGIVITDAVTPLNRIIYANKAFQELTGFSESELLGKGSKFLLGGKTRPTAAKAFRQALGEGARVQVTLSAVCKDGSQKWIEVSGGPFSYKEETKRYFIGTCRNVNDRVEAVEALMASEISFEQTDVAPAVSSFDEVTSLYNRSYFEEVAEREWEAMQRERRPLSLFLIGLPALLDFKQQQSVGDYTGVVGNIAASLRQVFRRGVDLVAKYDDERFIVISTGMGWEEAENMAARIKSTTDNELSRVVSPGVGLVTSVGLATLVPEKGLQVDTLIDAAEEALNEAVQAPQGSVVIADSGVDAIQSDNTLPG